MQQTTMVHARRDLARRPTSSRINDKIVPRLLAPIMRLVSGKRLISFL
jgi:hypothetical protein